MPHRLFLLLTCLYVLVLTGEVNAQLYTKEDSSRIYTLLDKADEEDMAGHLDQAFTIVNEALSLSKKKNMLRGVGFASLKLADLTLKREGSTGVDALYVPAFSIATKLKDSFLLGLAHHQKGQYYRDNAMYAEAGNCFRKAADCYRAINDINYLAIINNDRGFIYDRQGFYDSAAAMYMDAVHCFEKNGNVKEAANSTGNLGITYYRTGKKEEAVSLFKQSAAMRETIGDVKGLAAVYGNLVTAYSSTGNLDSALRYQQLALKNAAQTGVKNTLAQCYTNASLLSSKRREFKEAVAFEEKALQLYREMGDQQKIGNRYIVIAGLYDKLNDSVMAEINYNKALAIAESLANKPLFQNVYSAKSAFYTARNNYPAALNEYKNFVNYKDSMLNEKVSANISELQVKYDSERKDFEIAKLKADQQIKQLELEKQRALAAGNLLVAKRKEDQIVLLKQEQELHAFQLKQQQHDIEKQELQMKESEHQVQRGLQNLQLVENEKKLKERQLERERLLRNGMIGVTVLVLLLGALLLNRYQLRKKLQEQQRMQEVRNKISKDLHDDIGSTLTSIHILSSVSQKLFDDNPLQAREMIKEIASQSKNIQQNMSDIVWAIRSDNDHIENLVARMREYISTTLEPMLIDTTFIVADEVLRQRLPMDYRKEILLIFKEAVSNILKHSGAGKVEVIIRELLVGSFEMTITDDGKWKNNPHATGSGTRSIKQRAAAMGGRTEVIGSAAGTTIKVTVPLP